MRFSPAILVFVLIMPCGVMNAQDNTALKAVWTVDFNETLNRMSPGEKIRYDSMPVRAKENMQSAFQGRTFQFKDNDAVTVSFHANGQAREVTGTWSFDAESNYLVITAAGANHAYHVEWEGADRIRLKYKDAPSGAALSTLCLTRK